MVASSYPKFPGDVTAPFIESIAHAVAARGHAVDVLLPHHPDLRRPPGEPVRVLQYGYAPREEWSLWGYAQSLDSDVRVRRGMYLLAPLVALALRRALGSLLGGRRYDVVHAHWVVPNAAMITDVVAAHRVPFVVSAHGSDIFLAERSAAVRAFARFTLERAARVTACSDDLRRRAVALGAPEARTSTVPYGVDGATFKSTADAEFRERLGAPPGARLVLALGRLVEKKGFGPLVEAVAGLSGVQVAIAGAGDLHESLARRIAETGAPVRLVGPLDRRRRRERPARAAGRRGRAAGGAHAIGRGRCAARAAGSGRPRERAEASWLGPDGPAFRGMLCRGGSAGRPLGAPEPASRRRSSAPCSRPPTCPSAFSDALRSRARLRSPWTPCARSSSCVSTASATS